MTRPIEQIEAALVAARRAHQEAVEAYGLAKAKHADLKAQARRGEGSPKALADALDTVEFTEHAIAPKFEALRPLEDELAKATAERWADQTTATRIELRDELDRAFADVEGVLDRLVLAWRLDAGFLNQAAMEIGSTVRPDVTSRISRSNYGPAVVDRVPLQQAPVIDPLERLVQKTHQRLLNGQPKPRR